MQPNTTRVCSNIEFSAPVRERDLSCIKLESGSVMDRGIRSGETSEKEGFPPKPVRRWWSVNEVTVAPSYTILVIAECPFQ